jgi:hypothetical protein
MMMVEVKLNNKVTRKVQRSRNNVTLYHENDFYYLLQEMAQPEKTLPFCIVQSRSQLTTCAETCQQKDQVYHLAGNINF